MVITGFAPASLMFTQNRLRKADDRGEVVVILVNHGDQPFVIERGSRIAQMVVASHARVAWLPTADLETSARGAGGFGSTGFAAGPARAEKVGAAGYVPAMISLSKKPLFAIDTVDDIADHACAGRFRSTASSHPHGH